MRALRLSDLDRLFAYAERATALLDRVRPENGRAESERVTAAFRAGDVAAPEWRYRPPPDLSPLIRALDTAREALRDQGPWGALYADRAAELCAEARVAQAVGRPDFAARAEARFPVARSLTAAQADTCARSWIAEQSEEGGDRVPADDDRDPRSLVSRARRLAFELKVPVRVIVSTDLVCAAATGDGLIVVRAGGLHRPHEALRIALHEVHGHALPRHRARGERLGLFARGTAGGSDDEEGRALLIEERHGLLDAARRKELALRHLLALAVRQGADWVESVRLALSFDVTIEMAVSTANRVHRGGGLAREIVYLPARERVREAFASDPGLEEWLCRGRIGVEAARVLARLGEPPETAISAFGRSRQTPDLFHRKAEGPEAL